MSKVNSGVTGPKLTKFLQDVVQFIPLLMRQSAFRFSNPLWNASMTNEGRYAKMADFASKIGCHGNIP